MAIFREFFTVAGDFTRNVSTSSFYFQFLFRVSISSFDFQFRFRVSIFSFVFEYRIRVSIKKKLKNRAVAFFTNRRNKFRLLFG